MFWCYLPTYEAAPNTPPTPVPTMNEHKAISSNSLAVCISRLISPMPVPTEIKQIPAKRPPRCGIKTAHNCPTNTKPEARKTRAICETCWKQRDIIFRTHDGAVSDIITSPVGFSVPANTSSEAQTNVMKGAVRAIPSMK